MMDLIAWGLAALFLLILMDIGINTPAIKLWLANFRKRPVVLVIYPEGRAEIIVLKKNHEYSHGIYLPELNTAYTRTPGSVILLNGKIPMYIVYMPFGKTIHPAWAKALAIARQLTGEKHVRDIFQKLSDMESSGVVQRAAVEFEQLSQKENLTDEEKKRLEQAAGILDTYDRYKHAADVIGEIYNTLPPQVFEELVMDADASAYAQMIKDAETKERARMMEWIKRLQATTGLAVILGLIIIGIIIVWALVHPGGAPNVISAGAQAASKVVEANTASNVVGM